MEKNSKLLVGLTLSSLLFSCAGLKTAKNDANEESGVDRSPASQSDRRHAAPPPRSDFQKPADKTASKAAAPHSTHLGTVGGCNLDNIAGVVVGDVSVLEIMPRLARNGSLTGAPQATYVRNSRGELIQTMVVDIRNDRALLAPFFNGESSSFSELQVALAEASEVEVVGESHYKAVFSPRKAVHALNSALSFINGNYTTSTVEPKHTGHVMAAALAAIMATIDHPGCAEYFVSEASKIMGPQSAAYLSDFPFQKIREARRHHTIGSEWDNLGKKRNQLREDIESVDELLARSEKTNDVRLKQVERLLKLELEQLKLTLSKFGPCQKVIAYETAIFNPLKKSEDIAETWVNRCREAIEEKSADISSRLLSMSAEREVLIRRNAIFEQQMALQKDAGARQITQGKIDANLKTIEGFDKKSPELEIEKQLIDSYASEFPLRGTDAEAPSSINLELDKIATLSKEARKRRSGQSFNDDHQRITELRNDYYNVTRDYVTLGVFGGAAASSSNHSPASSSDGSDD